MGSDLDFEGSASFHNRIISNRWRYCTYLIHVLLPEWNWIKQPTCILCHGHSVTCFYSMTPWVSCRNHSLFNSVEVTLRLSSRPWDQVQHGKTQKYKSWPDFLSPSWFAQGCQNSVSNTRNRWQGVVASQKRSGRSRDIQTGQAI